MMTVAQLTQYFLSLDPRQNPARLAFYHFLKNLLPLDQTFHPEMIDLFYDRALSLQHWQINSSTLGPMIKSDLEAIASRHSLGFDIQQVVHSHEMQVINIEQTRDFAALLAKDIEKKEKNGEKVKTFRIGAQIANRPQDVLFVRLQKNGRLIAEVRQNTALLVDGELQLVRPHSRLCYTPELDFEPDVDQLLTTSLLKTARFRATGLDGRIMKGSFIQGASFHRTETFENPLNRVPELLQAVKNIERYFINPVTDPYYQKMMDNFEQVFNEKSQL